MKKGRSRGGKGEGRGLTTADAEEKCDVKEGVTRGDDLMVGQ